MVTVVLDATVPFLSQLSENRFTGFCRQNGNFLKPSSFRMLKFTVQYINYQLQINNYKLYIHKLKLYEYLYAYYKLSMFCTFGNIFSIT